MRRGIKSLLFRLFTLDYPENMKVGNPEDITYDKSIVDNANTHLMFKALAKIATLSGCECYNYNDHTKASAFTEAKDIALRAIKEVYGNDAKDFIYDNPEFDTWDDEIKNDECHLIQKYPLVNTMNID